MTEKDRKDKTRAAGKAPSAAGKRRRARRARRVRRIAAAATVCVLALGLVGMGIWLLLARKPEVVQQVYPMEYVSQIRVRAAENGLDPALPAAVILAESSYQPEAVSGADARGLMQLLPDTGRWIAEKFDETCGEDSLFDPETNIKYGCWYLGYLLRRFDGEITCAVAAYHAGQGTVDGWLANPEYSRDGATLETIPSQATDTYVDRVLRYYEKYAELYAEAEAA